MVDMTTAMVDTEEVDTEGMIDTRRCHTPVLCLRNENAHG